MSEVREVHCSCGANVYGIFPDGMLQRRKGSDWRGYCPTCGDRLRIVDRLPVAEPRVPASALSAAQSEAATLRRALRQVARELANDRAASGEGAWASEAAVQAIIEAALAAANEEVTP